LDGILGGAGRYNQAPPGGDGEILHAGLLRGGDFRQFAAAIVSGDSQSLELARAGIGRSGGEVVKSEVHFAGQQGQLSRCATAVGNVHDIDTGLPAEQFTRQVAAATIAARTVVQHAGVFFAVLDEVLHGADVVFFGQLCVHDQHVGHVNHQRDRLEVLGGVVRQVLKQPGVDGVRSQRGNAQGFAV